MASDNRVNVKNTFLLAFLNDIPPALPSRSVVVSVKHCYTGNLELIPGNGRDVG